MPLLVKRCSLLVRALSEQFERSTPLGAEWIRLIAQASKLDLHRQGCPNQAIPMHQALVLTQDEATKRLYRRGQSPCLVESDLRRSERHTRQPRREQMIV